MVLVYDASWFGFLTAVFEVYERKLREAIIVTSEHYQPSAFNNRLEVFTDKQKAERVWLGLKKNVSVNGLNQIYSSFLSGLPHMEEHLLAFIKMAFLMKGAEFAYGNPSVLKVNQVAKIVYREKHRMEAFIRFQLTKDNIYYAVIEPDFNVIPLLISHFEKRYADQKWLIYDLKRKYGIYYNLEKVEEVLMEFFDKDESQSIFSDLEDDYQSLWKDYFKHINIVERKNTKLHLQHVPKRYWKHLTEKSMR
ncbi:MAG: TIGR03915 family putative DNA repair protein [Sphingobacteriaceae bacterium]